MANKTEYYDAYCGGGGLSAGGRSIGGKEGSGGIAPCSKSYDLQPVGGRAQARAQATAKSQTAKSQTEGLPVYDADNVATVYSEADRGTHRIQPQWRDPRCPPEMRAANSTLYEPAERDPPNRNNFYVYRTTLVDALDTPCRPLAVPDVHKLRYMHNNYMTSDDWY